MEGFIMKAAMIKKCEKCGKEGDVIQVDEKFNFPCKCHAKNHVIRHYLCNDCKDDYYVSPNKRVDVIISPDIFYLILKAYGKYHRKFININLDENTMKPKYVLDKDTDEVLIHLHCTYKALNDIDRLYTQWMNIVPESLLNQIK